MTVKVKQVKKLYFNEYAYMEEWLEEHPQYKMLAYSFTFSYGYCLQYIEK